MQPLYSIQDNDGKSPGKVTGRLAIYTKDVMLITGRGDRTARKILSDIRTAFGKLKHQFVSVDEFCMYTGMDEALVLQILNS
jgi:hypothetical protein